MTAPLFEEARLAFAQDRLDRARALVESLLADEPDHLPAGLLLGEILLREGRATEAITLFERLVGRAPRSAAAHNALARGLIELDQVDEAYESASRARALLPEGENFRETGPVYLTLVTCLRGERRYKEALALAEEGLERTPDALLAECASDIEQEWAEAEKERC